MASKMRGRFATALALLLATVPFAANAEPLFDPADPDTRTYHIVFDGEGYEGDTLELTGRSFRLDLDGEKSSGRYYLYRGLLLLWDSRRRSYELVSTRPIEEGAWQSCWGYRVSAVRDCTRGARSARIQSTDPTADTPTPAPPAPAPDPAPAPMPDVSATRCDMSPEAFKTMILAATNRSRSAARQCGSESFPATAPLRWSDKLTTAARGHSRDMATNSFFSHTGSDGLAPWDRAAAAGYSYRSVGENIAAGQRTVGEVQSGWMDSDGHCRNIMSAGYTEMGAACVVDPGSRYGRYWTVLFGRQR